MSEVKENKVNEETSSEAKDTISSQTVDDSKNTSTESSEEDAKDSLDALNKELAETKDKYLRTLAEFENYKKRTIREKAELILNGGEKVITAILPVFDDMVGESKIIDKTCYFNKDSSSIVRDDGHKGDFDKSSNTCLIKGLDDETIYYYKKF